MITTKSEASEPNRNERHIYHRILSLCGEHKMKLILAILVLGSLFGGYWHLSDGCDTLRLKVEWVPIEGVEITGDTEPIANCRENQELELIIKVTTTEAGFLTVTVNREYMKPVELTKEKGNWSWLFGDEVTVIETYVGQNMTEFPFHVWARSKKEPDMYESGITIRASLNGCEKMAKAHIKILEVESTEPPGPTIPPTTPPNDGNCLGTTLLAILLFSSMIARKD